MPACIMYYMMLWPLELILVWYKVESLFFFLTACVFVSVAVILSEHLLVGQTVPGPQNFVL